MLLQKASRSTSCTTGKGIRFLLLLPGVSSSDYHHIKHWMIPGERPAEATPTRASGIRGFQMVSTAFCCRDSRMRGLMLLMRLQVDVLGSKLNLVLVHYHEQISGFTPLLRGARFGFDAFCEIFAHGLCQLLRSYFHLLPA